MKSLLVVALVACLGGCALVPVANGPGGTVVMAPVPAVPAVFVQNPWWGVGYGYARSWQPYR